MSPYIIIYLCKDYDNLFFGYKTFWDRNNNQSCQMKNEIYLIQNLNNHYSMHIHWIRFHFLTSVIWEITFERTTHTHSVLWTQERHLYICHNEGFSEPNYNDLTVRMGVARVWDIFIVRSLAGSSREVHDSRALESTSTSRLLPYTIHHKILCV